MTDKGRSLQGNPPFLRWDRITTHQCCICPCDKTEVELQLNSVTSFWPHPILFPYPFTGFYILQNSLAYKSSFPADLQGTHPKTVGIATKAEGLLCTHNRDTHSQWMQAVHQRVRPASGVVMQAARSLASLREANNKSYYIAKSQNKDLAVITWGWIKTLP